nr:winged helix-turn-helix domain-containing protein [Klebsiella michiganensis]
MPASRCLLLLIQQDGKTVARETFFEEVWIKHGSQVTSNGFYQNISLLRRAFKELGMEGDIIITLPRVGVRLDATISVTESQPCEMEKAPEPQVPLDGPVHEEVAAASVPEKKRLRPRCSLLWGLAALLSCLVGGFVAWQTEFDSYLQTYSPIIAKFSQQCHFFANNDVVDHVRHVNFIKRSKFECEEYSWVYLTLYPGQARVSVIRCRQPFSQWRDNQCLTKYYIKEVANAPA